MLQKDKIFFLWHAGKLLQNVSLTHTTRICTTEAL